MFPQFGLKIPLTKRKFEKINIQRVLNVLRFLKNT